MTSITQLRAEMVDWIGKDPWSHFITLNLNTRSTYSGIESNFAKTCGRLDRLLLGPKYARRPERRALILAIPEHVRSNAHLHCLGRFPTAPSDSELEDVIRQAWAGTIKSGTFHLRPAYDARGAALYMTKEFRQPTDMDRVFFSRTYWPVQSRSNR